MKGTNPPLLTWEIPLSRIQTDFSPQSESGRTVDTMILVRNPPSKTCVSGNPQEWQHFLFGLIYSVGKLYSICWGRCVDTLNERVTHDSISLRSLLFYKDGDKIKFSLLHFSSTLTDHHILLDKTRLGVQCYWVRVTRTFGNIPRRLPLKIKDYISTMRPLVFRKKILTK